MSCFEPPCELSNSLVAGCQKDDDNKRTQKGPGAGNAPLGKDDAEVLRRPGEQHLASTVSQTDKRRARRIVRYNKLW